MKQLLQMLLFLFVIFLFVVFVSAFKIMIVLSVLMVIYCLVIGNSNSGTQEGMPPNETGDDNKLE